MNEIEERSVTAFFQPNHLLDWILGEPFFFLKKTTCLPTMKSTSCDLG